MKFDPKNITNIYKYGGILIWGNDVGLVQQKKIEILQQLMPDYKTNLSLVNITATMLKEDETILQNEFNTSSLFSDKKVIVMDLLDESIGKMPATEFATKYLEEIFKKYTEGNTHIIITAGNLTTKSSLRRMGDYNSNIASIAYYTDETGTIKTFITNKLKNFTYNAEIINYLANSFGGDRMIILSELDKLIMYKGDDKNISFDDVKNVIQDNSMSNLNDFINAVANLDVEKSYVELQKLYSEGVFPIVPLRSLIAYFLKLQLYKYKSQNGLDLDELLSNEFWKQKAIMKQQLIKLSLENINTILKLLLDEECKMKGKIII